MTEVIKNQSPGGETASVTPRKRRLRVTLENSDSPECPNEWGGWRLYSFNTRHTSFKRIQDILSPSTFKRKAKIGLAWMLSYYEHGGCTWMLANSEKWDLTPDKQWDATRVAGMLVWESSWRDLGARTKEARQKDAEEFLEVYTDWCNGNVYDYQIHELKWCPHCEEYREVDELIDACNEFYHTRSMFEEIRRHTKGCDVEVDGEAKWLADFDRVVEKEEVLVAT